MSRNIDRATIDDPNPLYDWLRRVAPVYRVPGTSFYLVSTWAAVQEATSRVTDFSSNLTAALVQQDGRASVFNLVGDAPADHVLATADDPAHADERKLVVPGLVAKRIRESSRQSPPSRGSSSPHRHPMAPSSGCRRWATACR